VSTASFHIWRAKLAAASGHAAELAQPAAFIDLDLGGGIVLTIMRR
jgi:hypothetical protein